MNTSLEQERTLVKSLPMPMLDAASKGQIPHIKPFLAAAEMLDKQRTIAAANMGTQAAQAPQGTTLDTVKQGVLGLMQQQMQNRQQHQQNLGAQMAQTPPVRAAGGGLMSAVGRSQPAGMAALIRQHMTNPVKAADGGLMRLSQGTTEEKRRKLVEERARRDRELLRRAASGLPQTLAEQIAVLRDTGTMPIRGAAKLYDETVIRAMRALGLNPAELTPMLTPEGESADSPTPFTERALRQRETAPKEAISSGRGDSINPPMALDPDQPDYPTQQERKQPPPPPAPPRPGPRTQPPAPTAAQPAPEQQTPQPAPAEQGIGSLWERRADTDYSAIGSNAPDIEAARAEAAKLAEARRALFEKQNADPFGEWLQSAAANYQGQFPGINAMLAGNQATERQRMRPHEFDFNETEAGIKGEQALREQLRGYKEKASGQRMEVSGEFGRAAMNDRTTAEAAALAEINLRARNDTAHERALAMERLKSQLREQEARNNPRGVGGVEGDPKLVAAAERAFAADPRAKSIQKLLGTVVVSHQPDKVRQLNEELATIRAEKYRAAYRAAGLTPPVGAVDTGTGDADPGKVDTSNPLLR